MCSIGDRTTDRHDHIAHNTIGQKYVCSDENRRRYQKYRYNLSIFPPFLREHNDKEAAAHHII